MTDKNYLPSRLVSPVVVVCHDAGAANLIFAWLRDCAESKLLKDHLFRFVLKGPAKSILANQDWPMLNNEIHTELHSAFHGANCILTGSGWASSLEHDARKLASILKIDSIAVIDHWVNYTQRFERNSEVVWPNEIWVADPYAAELANSIFKDTQIVELPNTYLQQIVKNIPEFSANLDVLLYVLEPLRNDWGRKTLGEFQALDFFVENLQLITDSESVQILLRPHPSDFPGKYEQWIKKYPKLKLKIDTNPNLGQSIGLAKWVVGAETFAMVVACAAGRKTYSSLPPWAHRCRLPHKEIVLLSELI